MSRGRTLFWIGCGALVWAGATAVLSILAGTLFGSGATVYWLSTLAICAAFVGFFLVVTRISGTPPTERLRAAVLFAVPGLLGEVPVMLAFPTMVPSMHPEGAGAYAAFLFLGYAALLATAALPTRGVLPAKVQSD